MFFSRRHFLIYNQTHSGEMNKSEKFVFSEQVYSADYCNGSIYILNIVFRLPECCILKMTLSTSSLRVDPRRNPTPYPDIAYQRPTVNNEQVSSLPAVYSNTLASYINACIELLEKQIKFPLKILIDLCIYKCLALT